MSPDEDLPPPQVALDNMSDDPLTPEEQAQFDAMRGVDDGEPPPSPEPPPEPETPPQPQLKAGEKPPAPQEPDPDPDLEVTDPKTGTKQKRVSIHKYQRLEERAKAAEEERTRIAAERQELLDRFSRADERLKIISEAMATPEGGQQQQQEEDPQPDPEKDIFGAFQWAQRQIGKLSEKLNSIEQGAVDQTQETEIANAYRADAGRYAQSEPAFAEAYVYLITQRDRELELAGVTDKRAREQQIVREEKGLVAGAIKANRSPAEMIFKMAEGRGYKKTAAPPPPANGGGEQQQKDPKALDAPVNGSKPPPAQAAPPPAQQQQQKAPTVTEEIEAIKRGQEAAASLSNVGGGAPVQELTSAALADMSEEDFNKLIERLPRERVMELMGN